MWLETLALAVILQLIETGDIELLSSSGLGYENRRNSFPLRKRWVIRCLQFARHSQQVDERIRAQAQELEQEWCKVVNALHLACAEASGSQYFLTCDDRVVR